MGCAYFRSMDEKPDDITGLSRKDVRLIRRSWKLIQNKSLLIPTGAELFVRLFSAYPEMMDYFQTFNLRESPAETNQKLSEHALTFMNGINLYVTYIDDPELWVALLHKVAISHLERLVTTKDMERMASFFVKTLRSQLGSSFSVESERAWDRFFYFVNTIYAQVELQINGIIRKRSTQTISTKTSSRTVAP
ncbi:globin [Plakobranchus ocellatus]|uniref:Globin n=1 Tax=Plakobranchus ocellatus TaxID=259542 RepID=A0AAV3YPF9_9GAST|nr:globin [Plakobranchus ocellatus]